MQRPKISIFGAGGTGCATAEALVQRGFVDVVLVDIQGAIAEARAMDIQQMQPLIKRDFTVQGGSDPSLTDHSDIVVITAGLGRKPGLVREQLVSANTSIVRDIAKRVAQGSPNASIIVLTNPADIMTHIAWQSSGFQLERVIGQGGVLDSARLALFVAEQLHVSPVDVDALVLGGHGDSMVPVENSVSVHGVPARGLLTNEQWQSAVHQTRYAGDAFLQRFQRHGAATTPGWAVAQMIEALLSDVPRLLPVSTYARGEYGITDVFIGLPALVSNKGVERVVEVPLTSSELQDLQASAAILKKAMNA